jgi:phosphonate transport system permease protein
MAIWGLIFVRAVGLGPLAGVLAIIMQDTGLLGRLYAEGHEAVDRSPGRGLTAVGANGLQKHRFGIFTPSNRVINITTSQFHKRIFSA